MPAITSSFSGDTLTFTTTLSVEYTITVSGTPYTLNSNTPVVINNVVDTWSVDIYNNSNSQLVGIYHVYQLRDRIFGNNKIFTAQTTQLDITSFVDLVDAPNITIHELTSSNTWSISSATATINSTNTVSVRATYNYTVAGLTAGTLYTFSASASSSDGTTYTIPFSAPTPSFLEGILSDGQVDITLNTSTTMTTLAVSLFTGLNGSTPVTNADGSARVITASVTDMLTTVPIPGLTNETPYYIRTSYIYNGLSTGLSDAYGPYTPSATRTVITNAVLFDTRILLTVNLSGITGITGTNLVIYATAYSDLECTQAVKSSGGVPLTYINRPTNVPIDGLSPATPYYVKTSLRDTDNNITFAESIVSDSYTLQATYKTVITTVDEGSDQLVAKVDCSAIPGSTPSTDPNSLNNIFTVFIDVYNQGSLVKTVYGEKFDNKNFIYLNIDGLTPGIGYTLQSYIQGAASTKLSLSTMSGPHSLNPTNTIPEVIQITHVKSGNNVTVSWTYNVPGDHATLVALIYGTGGFAGVRYLSTGLSTTYTFGPGNLPYGTYTPVAVYTVNGVPYKSLDNSAVISTSFTVSDSSGPGSGAKEVTAITATVNGSTVTANLTYSSIVSTDQIWFGIATSADFDGIINSHMTIITGASTITSITFPYTNNGATLSYGTYYLLAAYKSSGMPQPVFSSAFTVSDPNASTQPSSDNTLSSAGISCNGVLLVDGATTDIPFSASGYTVDADPNDPAATIVGAGSKSLVFGPNTITITVTAANGSPATYNRTVNVISSGNSGSTSLAAFTIGGVDMMGLASYEFPYNTPDTVPINVTLPNNATFGSAPSQSVAFPGGMNLAVAISFTVVAQDGSLTTHYYRSVTRAAASSDKRLSVFKIGTTDVVNDGTITLPPGTTTISVTATPTATSASAVLISPSGASLGSSVPVQNGANTITVRVTAQDGSMQDYTVIATVLTITPMTLSFVSATQSQLVFSLNATPQPTGPSFSISPSPQGSLINNNNGTITVTGLTAAISYTLQAMAAGYTPASAPGTTSAALASGPAPICFLADAPVLTPSGYRAISTIKMGDKVLTADGRLVTVRSTYAKRYLASAATNPYVIPKGTFGATESLPISPNHEVLVPGRGMIKAKHLGLRQMAMKKSFVYYNLELDDWVRDNMVVAGVTVESLAPTKRITMSREEYADFVYNRYGTPTADTLARIKQVFYRLEDGRVSAPVFGSK